jgi:hypothetical protein
MRHIGIWLTGLIKIMLLIGLLNGVASDGSRAGQRESGASGGPSLEELASEIAGSESKLLNLKVESQATVQKRGSQPGQWEDTPVCVVCTAWYNGLPGSKVRVDVVKEVLEWEDGPAPLGESSYSVAFDGQYGRTARHNVGPVGETAQVGRGEISADRPAKLKTQLLRAATGAGLSTFFFRDNERAKLSDLFKEAASQNTAVQITSETLLGFSCIKVTGGDPAAGHQSYWFDPSRGFALVGYELINKRTDGTLWVVGRIRVSELREAAPGIWYPTEGYYECDSSPESGDEADRRYHYRASIAVANDPAFDESVFSPMFPAGYTIDDRVQGLRYRSGGNPRDLEKTLDKMAAEVLGGRIKTGQSASEAGQASPPNASPELQAQGGARPLSTEVTRPSGNSRVLLGVILTMAGLIATAGVIVYCRKRRCTKIMPLLFLSLFLLLTPGLPTARCEDLGIPLSASDPSIVYHSNCGLNVSYITARLLGLDVSLGQIGEEIGAGRAFERTTSFADLKRVFENHGMLAEGLKADMPGEILESLGPDNVIILRLQRESAKETFSHFSVIRWYGDSVVLIDPPREPSVFARAGFVEACRPWQLTGEFLVVSGASQGSVRGPAVRLERDVIDLGNIPVTMREIQGEIVFQSVGSVPLQIVKTSGTCSCFVEAVADKEKVEPGQSGRIRVKFNKEKMSLGQQRQPVYIATNDAQKQVVKAYFTFLVQGTPARKDIRLLPQNVDFGRSFCSRIQRKVVPLKIVIPEDPNHKLISVDVRCSSPLLSVTRQEDAEAGALATDVLDPTGMTTVAYVFTWQDPPAPGCFTEKIQFLVKQEGLETRTFEVLVRGEAIAETDSP